MYTITIITLFSFLLTKIMDKTIILKLCKNYMDDGYNLNSFNEKEIFENIIEIPILATITPIYNIICRLFVLNFINHNTKEIFNSLEDNKAITKMDLTDIINYKKHPNFVNALYINYKLIKEKQKIIHQKVILTIDNKENEIEYKINDIDENLEITKLKGTYDNNLSSKEAEEIIKISWFILLTKMEKLYGNKYVLIRELKKNDYYSLIFEEENDLHIEKVDIYYDAEQLPKILKYYNKQMKNSRD